MIVATFLKINLNILILGVGNIGIRHIQGLINYKKKLVFYILDTNKNYKSIFKDEIKEIRLTNDLYEINSLNEIKKINFELTIISTTANSRIDVLRQIITSINYKYILLEKPICTSIKDLKYLNTNLNKKIFINFPRRYCDWHNKIKEVLTKNYTDKIKKIEINGSNLGIACNACHFVDLINYWTNKKLIKVDNSRLKKWINSKRPGFYEVIGKITFIFENDVVLTINSDKKFKDFDFKIFDDKSLILTIDYKNKIAKFENDFKLVGEIKKQSKSSHILLGLLQNQNLNICKLETEINSHEKILKSLIDFWNLKNNQKVEEVMIT